MNKPTQILAGAFVAGSVLLTAGCGSSGRPSVGGLTDGLAKVIPTITKGQAECIAKVFRDSKLSDDALKKIAEGKVDSKMQFSAADDAAGKEAVAKMAACESVK